MAKQKENSNNEQFEFNAETGKILQLMIHSLYTHKEIFLRELASNASDACDKLRYQAIETPDLLEDSPNLTINLSTDKANRQLTITDNGIGMSKEELIENLGTLARSGTQRFLEAMTGDSKKDLQLIGQFGVGFYSSFMVADTVSVTSRKAGEKQAYRWESKGDNHYTVEAVDTETARGTSITLHLKEECNEFLDKHRLSHIVKTYSDHVSFPITFTDEEGNTETLNDSGALWTKPQNDISEESYTEFYKSTAHAGDTPWMTLHNKVEGNITYTNLLFIPSSRPFDLFHPDRKTNVKLYVKRVFISEDVDLVPSHMRFLKGVVDSEDLPLNISRETLQHNNVVYKIRNAIVKKVTTELKKKAEKAPEEYAQFWDNFGSILKEGLCESMDAKRDQLLEICRFNSVQHQDKTISLDDYIANMKDGQDTIYYLTGDNKETLLNSPQLEGFVSQGIDVLLLTDSVDDFWVNVNHEYKEKAIKSVTRVNIDLDNKDETKTGESEEETSEQQQKLIETFKEVLGSKIADVMISKKLNESPVCLVVPEGGMDIRMERFLLEQKQLAVSLPKILEINPQHELIQYVEKNGKNELTENLIHTLFDQACIVEGEPLTDQMQFAKRITEMLQKLCQ
jgi:molecular chaperone HtpG